VPVSTAGRRVLLVVVAPAGTVNAMNHDMGVLDGLKENGQLDGLRDVWAEQAAALSAAQDAGPAQDASKGADVCDDCRKVIVSKRRRADGPGRGR